MKSAPAAHHQCQSASDWAVSEIPSLSQALGSNEISVSFQQSQQSRSKNYPVVSEKLQGMLLIVFDSPRTFQPMGFAQKILGGHRPPLQLEVRNCRGALWAPTMYFLCKAQPMKKNFAGCVLSTGLPELRRPVCQERELPWPRTTGPVPVEETSRSTRSSCQE